MFLDKIEGSVLKALSATEALFGRVDARIATYLSQKQALVYAQIERNSVLPDEVDQTRLAEVKRIVAENYAGEMLDKTEEAKIIAMTYNVSVKVEQNPELYKVELVNAGTLGRLLPGVAKYAFDVFSKYIRGQATKQFIEIITKDEDLSGKALEKSRHKDENKSKSKPAEGTTVGFGGGLEPDDDEKYKQYDKFKKKDGSDRYECEPSESPQWNEAKPYKGKYRTNAKYGKDLEFYRWDKRHKDIEIYDDKARYMGSKDPVTGQIYRKGTMKVNKPLQNILK